MFRAGQTTEVTFYIRKVIWSTSGSDYLLNHNKTTHSIFVRRGMEGYSFHFTHLLVNDFWVKNWWKSQSQQKASQWCFSVTSARHRAGFPHRTSQRAQRFFFFFSNQNMKKNTPNCCENDFIQWIIWYSTDLWLAPCMGVFLITVYHFYPMLLTVWTGSCGFSSSHL